VNPLWRSAQPNTPANVAAAERFVKGLEANGGTQLEKAVTASLGAPDDPDRLRVVVFNTDGFAGQENVILDEVRKHRGQSRLFAFGIGNSVNRYLIDAMATEGRGDMEVVTLAEQADGAVDRLYRRANSPVLTDVSVRAEGLRDLTPAVLPDVFLERPVVVLGRYDRPGPAQLTVTGTRGDGTPWSQTLNVELSDRADAPAIPSLWARRRIDDLKREAHASPRPLDDEIKVKDRIVSLALAYRIMSEYTSFVAVEKRVVNVGGKVRTVRVPVEMADGVSYDKTVGAPASARFAGGGFGGATLKSAPAPRGATAVGQVVLRDGMPAIMRETPEQLYARKVEAKLREAKGVVQVQVLLSKWDEATLKALAELGLKVEAKDKGLKAVFGSVDAAKLKSLAQYATVVRIMALE
jgi:Ca-activated chloride channel family protein